MYTRIRAGLRSPERFTRLKDFLYAHLLFSLPQGTRRRLFEGNAHYCPVCRSRLRRFLTIHRAYHLWCPVCRSLQRHRLLWLLIEREGLLEHPPGSRLKLLHFAPELCLEQKFRQAPGVDYLSVDLYDRRAMLQMDIAALQLEDDTFDLVFCSHVLEHVLDDRRALGELNRALKPGGKAVILVPIIGEATDEDPSITSPTERERRFGQLDHVRRYGMDFTARLEQARFSTQTLNAGALGVPAQERQRLGLDEADIVFICRK